MINTTPYYTKETVAAHLARSYSNILRCNAESGEFEELHGGNWVEIDEVRLEHYTRSAINVLLSHAMNVGRDAMEELYNLNNEVSFYEIGKLVARELRYPPMVEEESEAVEEVQ